MKNARVQRPTWIVCWSVAAAVLAMGTAVSAWAASRQTGPGGHGDFGFYFLYGLIGHGLLAVVAVWPWTTREGLGLVTVSAVVVTGIGFGFAVGAPFGRSGTHIPTASDLWPLILLLLQWVVAGLTAVVVFLVWLVVWLRPPRPSSPGH